MNKNPILYMANDMDSTFSVGMLIEVLQQLNPKLPIVINENHPIIMVSNDENGVNGEYYSLNSKSYFEEMIEDIKEIHAIK